MTATYWKQDKSLDSIHSSIVWIQARSVGVHFEYRNGAYETYRLTRDARPVDVQRWEAANALSSLGRAIREHEMLKDCPLLRWALFYIAVDYIAAIFDR